MEFPISENEEDFWMKLTKKTYDQIREIDEEMYKTVVSLLRKSLKDCNSDTMTPVDRSKWFFNPIPKSCTIEPDLTITSTGAIARFLCCGKEVNYQHLALQFGLLGWLGMEFTLKCIISPHDIPEFVGEDFFDSAPVQTWKEKFEDGSQKFFGFVVAMALIAIETRSSLFILDE